MADKRVRNDNSGCLWTNKFHTWVDGFQMEVGGSDRLQTPINQGHLTGQSSLPLVVPTTNTVT